MQLTRKQKNNLQSRALGVFTEFRSTSQTRTPLRQHFANLTPFQVSLVASSGVDTVSSCKDVTPQSAQHFIDYQCADLTVAQCVNDKHMSVDVISWLKSLPKNKPLCQHFPQQLNFHLSVVSSSHQGDSQLYITCVCG